MLNRLNPAARGRARALLIALLLAPWAAPAGPLVHLQTNLGTITLELDADKAPKTVANFLEYAESGFYEGTIFHRVIDGFVVQGGGFTADYRQKPTRAPIRNEADNGLRNVRGTVAMARTFDPHSATAQFFINLADNAFLDHREPSPRGWGYCVFGRVTEGMDVVDRIASLPTGAGGPFPQDVPKQTVVIEKVTVESGAKKAPQPAKTEQETTDE